MPKNIEVKAKVRNWERTQTIAQSITDQPLTIIHQTDTFFNSTQGRLKLRDFGDGTGELIWYSRQDRLGAKTSDYKIVSTTDPLGLVEVLSLSYGVQCVVRKTRELYLVGQTRIHLDRVEGLGEFMELEYVMREDEDATAGESTVNNLLRQLEIHAEDHIAVAYADLLRGIGVSPVAGVG